MKKFAIYTLIAILTFVSFLAVFAPASLVWRQVQTPLQNQVPDLSVTTVRGTLWDGKAEIFYRQFPGSLLSWQITASGLLRQQVQADLQLKGEGHEIESVLTAERDNLQVHSLLGYIDSSYINRVSQPQGLTFIGTVEVQDLSLQSDLKWIQQATGRVYWSGGKIVSRTTAAGTRVFDLPALVGDLAMQGRNINLTIHPNDSNQTLIEIVLKPDGWVVVAVKARLFDLAGLAWPSGSSLEDTVLQFEEQVLRGAR